MLTDRQIQTAIKTVTTEITLNDKASGRGVGSLVLVVRRMAGGGASAQWFARWKREGKREKMSLGRYPELSLSAARQKFNSEISPLIQTGQNPRGNSDSTEDTSLGALLSAYIDNMKSRGKISWEQVERVLLKDTDNAADALGRDRPAGEVTPHEVANYIARFWKRGSVGMADKARCYLMAAYSWAIKSTHDYRSSVRKNWHIDSNPASAVPRDTASRVARDRNLSADELRSVWNEFSGAGGSSAAIRLLICCGQRVQETLRVEGKEVDLVAGVWLIPARKTKGRKKDHRIPLPKQAIEIFRQLIDVHGAGYLFPAAKGSRLPNMDYPALYRVVVTRFKAGVIPEFQVRDIRRTWKSRTHDAGIDRATRDMIQQHAKQDTATKHYDRADYMPQMREAMNKWEAWISSQLQTEKQV